MFICLFYKQRFGRKTQYGASITTCFFCYFLTSFFYYICPFSKLVKKFCSKLFEREDARIDE